MTPIMDPTTTSDPNATTSDQDEGFTGICPPRGSRHPSGEEVIDMLIDIGPGAIVYMVIPVILFLVMSGLFINQIHFLIKINRNWTETMLKLWILAALPFMSGMCVIGIYLPRASPTISFVISFYNAMVMLKYYELMMLYYGGKKGMEKALRGQQFSGHPFPCFFLLCCPPMAMNVKSITFLQNLIYSVAIFQPMVYFILTVVWQEELQTSTLAPLVTFFNFCIPASTAVCVYAFVCMNRASLEALQLYRIKGKFLCVQAIIFSNTTQGILLKLMDILVGIPCTFPYSTVDQGYVVHLYVFVYELTLIALASHYLYKKDEKDCYVIHKAVPENYQISETFVAEHQEKTNSVRLVRYSPNTARSNGDDSNHISRNESSASSEAYSNRRYILPSVSSPVTSNSSQIPLVHDTVNSPSQIHV